MNDNRNMKAGQSDYKAMFKKHVHSNLILHSKMRDIESLKRKKMQELERNKEQFKMRYARYSENNGVKSTSSPRYRSDTKSAAPKPVFIVCEDFPCSFRTWSAITDVNDSSLDIYKTDVLQTEDPPVSFRGQDELDSTDDLAPRTRVRSYTMPVIHRNRLNVMPTDTPNTSNNDIPVLPDISIPSHSPSYSKQCEHSHVFRRRTHSDVSHIKYGMYRVPEIRLGNKRTIIRVGSVEEEDAPQATNADSTRRNSPCEETHPPVYRRCQTSAALPMNPKPGNKRPPLRRQSTHDSSSFHSPERRRCSTMDNTKHPPSLQNMLQRRDNRNNSYVGREAYTGRRRGSLFDRLLSASCSALDKTSNNGNSDNDLAQCRYIRVQGENIDGSNEEICLENMDFHHEVSNGTEESKNDTAIHSSSTV